MVAGRNRSSECRICEPGNKTRSVLAAISARPLGPSSAICYCLPASALPSCGSKLCMRVFFSLLIAASLLGCAHQPQWKCAGVTSPDQKLRACVSSVGKHGPPFNESRIEIHDVNDHVLAFKDFRSPDGEHGHTFKEVDDFTGPIIKRDFTLSAPDWIEVTVQGTKSNPTDIVTGHKVKRQLSAFH